MEFFFAAIIAIEGWRGPGTVGAAGEIGPYQITEAYWKDSGVPGSHKDCEDKAYSEKVMLAYFKRYCNTALNRKDWLTLASVHHSGPSGRYRMFDDYARRALDLTRSNQASAAKV